MKQIIDIGNVVAELEKINLGQLQAELDPVEIGESEIDIERNENLYKKATVKNGTVKKYGSKIEVKDGTILIKKGNQVYYNANVPEGKYFDYWAYPDGEVYIKQQQDFYVALNDLYGDYNLIAVFSDNPVQRNPEVRFIEYDSKDKYTHISGTRRYDFNICSDIINTYIKKEWGIIYSHQIIDDERLVLENHDDWIGKIIDTDPATKNSPFCIQSFWKEFKASWFENERLVKLRVYAIIEQNGEEQTIYSDEVITIQLHQDMS